MRQEIENQTQLQGIKYEKSFGSFGVIDMLKGCAAECSTVINEFQPRRLGNIEYMRPLSLIHWLADMRSLSYIPEAAS